MRSGRGRGAEAAAAPPAGRSPPPSVAPRAHSTHRAVAGHPAVQVVRVAAALSEAGALRTRHSQWRRRRAERAAQRSARLRGSRALWQRQAAPSSSLGRRDPPWRRRRRAAAGKKSTTSTGESTAAAASVQGCPEGTTVQEMAAGRRARDVVGLRDSRASHAFDCNSATLQNRPLFVLSEPLEPSATMAVGKVCAQSSRRRWRSQPPPDAPSLTPRAEQAHHEGQGRQGREAEDVRARGSRRAVASCAKPSDQRWPPSPRAPPSRRPPRVG